ncbi:unnamed protein product [Paramecium pentaurelia]|uniref:Transmembrane protein n=1 Tax=Paramecium pentaurelia TaxID=43138 RepID=A0A8S1S883_9CILI|nr:unnamed protein product [Paramecium pentaurelia]
MDIIQNGQNIHINYEKNQLQVQINSQQIFYEQQSFYIITERYQKQFKEYTYFNLYNLHSIFKIKQNARNRFCDLVYSIKQRNPQRCLIMILDSITAKILSSIMKLKDLIDMRISTIEKLEFQRKPYSKQDAFYFITPSDDSVNRLIDDFKEQLMYRKINVIFSYNLPQRLLQQIFNQIQLIVFYRLKNLIIIFTFLMIMFSILKFQKYNLMIKFKQFNYFYLHYLQCDLFNLQNCLQQKIINFYNCLLIVFHDYQIDGIEPIK